MKYPLKIFNTFKFKRHIELNEPWELYIDIIPDTIKTCKRILLLLEPREISPACEQSNKEQSQFDIILAHDPDILKNCNNSILHEFGTSWIKDFEFREKKYCITTLIGGKKLLKNHPMRHELLTLKQRNLNIKLDFFNSTNYGVKSNVTPGSALLLPMKNPERKNELFYSQFHICIENVDRENWFTEKILDCFQTKTIPIYFGCPNMQNWFDINGILSFDSIDSLIDIIENITEDTYASKKDSIEYNFQQSHKFTDFGVHLERKLKQLKLID